MDANTNTKLSTNPLPANWKKGFEQGNIVIACGGAAIPVWHPIYGWTMLVWNKAISKHFTYSYGNDCFYPDPF